MSFIFFSHSVLLIVCGCRLHTDTPETLLEISILVAERFGWTMLSVVVQKRTLRHVYTTAGEDITVVTVRMSH